MGKNKSISAGALVAQAAQLHNWPDIGEPRRLAGISQRTSDAIIIKVARRTAIIADQEYAVMPAPRMAVGKIGIRTLDPVGKVRPHEQVKDTIDGIGGHSLVAPLTNIFGNIVGRSRAVIRGQGFEHVRAHGGPLLARIGEHTLGFRDKVRSGMFVMCMCCHGRSEIFLRQPSYKQGCATLLTL